MTPAQAAFEQVMKLREKATPGPLRIREHPAYDDQYFVAAVTPEGHPYYGVTKDIQVQSDEDYPTKRADAELHVAAVNFLALLPAYVAEQRDAEAEWWRGLVRDVANDAGIEPERCSERIRGLKGNP